MPNEPRHPLVEIKDALSEFATQASSLAKAEIGPSAKAAGIGTGFFAGAAVFVFHALWMIVIVIALAVGLLLNAITPIGPMGSFTLGFLVSVLFSLLVAGVLFTLGRGKFSQVKMPEATMAETKATLDAVVDTIANRPASTAVVTVTETTEETLERSFGRP